MIKPTVRDLDRFWSYVEKTDTCWEWKSTIIHGYGQMWFQGKQHRAHRLSYQFAYGDIPTDMFVCHACDNRRCVRPDHLWLGTTDDNMADMVAKGRSKKGETNPSHIAGGAYQRGERNGRSKLTPDQVLEIRRRGTPYTRTICSELATEYGVSHTAIRYILKGRNWKHIDVLARKAARDAAMVQV